MSRFLFSISVCLMLTTVSLFCVPSQLLINDLEPHQTLTLKWKTRSGLSNYRTSVAFQNNLLLVPSNGQSTGSFLDEGDGLYVMKPDTGKVMFKYLEKREDDRDANGVAATSERMFFTSDDNTVYALNWLGEKAWSTPSGGDVECTPALEDFDGDGTMDVCFSTESGEVTALNGKDGAALWTYQTDFMPVWTYPSSKAFMSSPALADLNKDGIRDVVIGSRNGTLFALDGKTGEVLWTFRTQTPSGIFTSVFATPTHLLFAESYNVLYVLNYKGTPEKTIILGNSDTARTFSSPVETPEGTIIIGSSGPKKNQQGVWIITKTKTLFKPIGKVSATPIIADILGSGSLQCVILTESGGLFTYSESGDLLGKFTLPYGGEATPFVEDMNGDGLLELVLLTSDQYVSCYQTSSTGNIYWGGFRGNPYNTGVINDTLLSDFPDSRTPQITPTKTKGAYTMSRDYSNQSDAKAILISEEGIGPAKLGMTFGRLKAVLGSKATYADTTLDIGMKAKAILFGKDVQFYILFPTWKTLSDTDIITILGTNNPSYKTEKGIGPGSTIEAGVSKYGPAILTYHSERAIEELIRFKNKPLQLWFARYGSSKIGVYTGVKPFNSTNTYTPGSSIDFIGVKK